ncbi:MAG TPA: hypothetical protein VK486_02490 [Thermoleophilaceae bacterium]|nr:hypothetical protein [Thermoleophilaceae bacterium]
MHEQSSHEESSPTPSLPFPIGGPATSAWREQAFSRAADYRFLARLLLPRASPRDLQALDAIERKINAAEHAAGGSKKTRRTDRSALGLPRRFLAYLTGAGVERTNSQLDGVETDLLRLAPDPYLRGQLPNLVAHVHDHLPDGDPRRQQVEAIAGAVKKRSCDEPLCGLETDQLLGAVRSASLESRRKIRQVRSFRNVLLLWAAVLTLGVIGITALGVLAPERIPLCFAPEQVKSANVVCPTHSISLGSAAASQQKLDEEMRKTVDAWDVLVVEIVGLLAAALAGAVALRSMRGTSTPYSLPVAVAVLKLPSGALTAVIGLLLMRGGFVPGLSALDTSAQIIAWAIVFGYSQQLLTRLVDRQANTVLENVARPTTPQPSPTGTPAPAAG